MEPRQHGCIVFMNQDKGFGFIRSASRVQHYFRLTDAPTGAEAHSLVTFESTIDPGQKRPRAVNINLFVEQPQAA